MRRCTASHLCWGFEWLLFFEACPFPTISTTTTASTERVLPFKILYLNCRHVLLVRVQGRWEGLPKAGEGPPSQMAGLRFFFFPRSCHVAQLTFHFSLPSLKFTIFIQCTTHNDFDSADPSSAQDACHI